MEAHLHGVFLDGIDDFAISGVGSHCSRRILAPSAERVNVATADRQSVAHTPLFHASARQPLSIKK